MALPFFYGWAVVAVAFLTLAISVNVRTAFSLLYPPILAEFGWERGVTAAAFSIGFVASAGFTPIVGMLMDRFGPRAVIPLGAVLVSLGFIGAVQIDTPLGLYATLGLLVVGGSIAMSYISHSMFVPNWFVRRRGLAVGIAFAGVGIGALPMVRLVQYLIDGEGWRYACLAMAALVALPLIPLNIWLQRRRPQDLGLLPDGDDHEATASGGSRADPVVNRAWAETDWTLGKALRTAPFWWIFVGYFCGLFVWYSVQVHQTKYLLDVGFDGVLAADALALVGLCGIAGQIGIGAISDRIGRELSFTIAALGFVACYGLLLLLQAGPSMVLLGAMVAVQGLFGYGLASLYGPIPADLFAGRRFATIFAVVGLGGNVGAGVGPWATGYIYDVTGSYAPAFWLCMGLSLVSVLCIWMAAPRRVRLVAGQAARRAAAPAAD
ncbi:MAG: MFS transporter [Hyphomicrobiales bacterium]|nr:MFS transporter [Hyphomicrobiales bacterium]MCP5371028.1 MFS transporter [Hyphomicrobiales bacterium]